MSLPDEPVVARDIASFDGAGGTAAKLNYDVPLPSVHTGRRTIALDIGLQAQDWTVNAPAAQPSVRSKVPLAAVSRELEAGDVEPGGPAADAIAGSQTLNARAGVRTLANGRTEVDRVVAAEFAREQIASSGVRGVPESALIAAVRQAGATGLTTRVRLPVGPEVTPQEPGLSGPSLEDVMVSSIADGKLIKFIPVWGGGVVAQPVPLNPPVRPSLFLIEVYGISSFLGDYGLGRTVRTFSLLPGENTTISVNTWRSRSSTRTAGSSIVDSFSSSSADRFSNAFQAETSDASTNENTHAWGVGIDAKVGIDLGLVQIGGGTSMSGSGQYHSSRTELAKSVSNVMREHTNESNAAREMSVTSSSEMAESEGESTATVRTIRNINVRRTLNFVFRELNQEYTTKFHLRDVRVGYTDGTLGSWREVPLSGLRGLLDDVVVPGKVAETAQQVLRHVSVMFDRDDNPVNVLEALTLREDGSRWDVESPARRTVADAQGRADRDYAVPDEQRVYRFAPGPLAQGDESNQVDGVLLSETTFTMRTDSLVVEALLGQADALDPYAMLTQKADAESRELANERERLAHQVVAAVGAGDGQADAFAEMFRSDGIVRLALNNGNGNGDG